MELTLAARAALLTGLSFLAYVLYGVIYRLYLSPLAKVPGPKLAALTQAYEMYYDMIEKARFPWKIEELHAKYGRARHLVSMFPRDAADVQQQARLFGSRPQRFISMIRPMLTHISRRPVLFHRTSMPHISTNLALVKQHSTPLTLKSTKYVVEH